MNSDVTVEKKNGQRETGTGGEQQIITPAKTESSPAWGLNPFGAAKRIMEDFERLFDGRERLGQLVRWFEGSEAEGSGGGADWNPRVDVIRKDDSIVVRADIPGVRKEDITVEVDDDHLVLKGKRESSEEEKREGYYRSERSYGSFYRSIPLPKGVDKEQVKAGYKDGVLEVNVPVAGEGNEARRIEIG